MLLKKGGAGWRPDILVSDDLDKVAARLQVDRKDVEDWKKFDYVWDNRLRRLVEKDGTLNTVSKRRLHHWAVWDYKSLMRYSWFSLLLWSVTIYVTFTTFIAAILFWSNEVSTKAIQPNATLAYKNEIEAEYKVWVNVDDLYDAYLMAIEMVTTIGYGTRTPNSATSVAVNVTMLTNFLSVMITSIFSGVFLAWIMKSQAAQIKFSSVAIICKIDGCLALMIRLADPVISGLALVEVSGFCVHVRRDHSSEGQSSREVELLHMGDMSFSCFSNGSHKEMPLMWPTVMAHRIDDTSPLYTFTPSVLETHCLEIIINVSGIRVDTGSSILCKTSYIR